MSLFPSKGTVKPAVAAPGVKPAMKSALPPPAAAAPPPTPEELHARMAAMAFAGIDGLDAGESNSPRDRPGSYISRIEKVLLKVSENKKTRGQFVVIVEKTILFVTRPDDKEAPNTVGEKTGQVFMLAKEPAYKAFKRFVAKVLDIPTGEVGQQAAAHVSAPSQPLAGTIVVHNNIYSDKPLENGAYFLNCNYERAVSATEMLENYAGADEDQKEQMAAHKARFFPEGVLERMAEVEAQQAAQAQAEAEQGTEEQPQG